MPDAFAVLSDQDIDSKVVLDYTSRDFTAIRSQLIGLARGLMPEWATVGEPSDFGTLLLELFAYFGDVMHFYIDRTASEAFLGTAVRQQSVLYIADMLGYTPIGQQAATVKLLFSMDKNALDGDPTQSLTLPAGTRIHNETSDAANLIVFETDLAVTLHPGDGSSDSQPAIVGYATEGVVISDALLGVSQGSPNTELVIPDKGVVFGSIQLQSREGFQVVPYTYVSDLSLSRPTQPVFTTFLDDTGHTHIVFGDNAVGRVPPVGANLFVTYRFGVGAEANLLESGSIITIVPPDSTVDLWGVTVTNPDPPLGGTDPESVDSMRQSIPRAAAQIKNRAITLNDYADLALQVPGVVKSIAYGTVYTAVHVKIAPVGGTAPTEEGDTYMSKLCNEVEIYMADKVIVGSTVYAEPLDINELWQFVFIRLMVHVQNTYNRTSVRTAVDQTVRQVLAFDNVDFGTRISIGQIYRSALAVQGVEWVDLLWLDTSAPGHFTAVTATSDGQVLPQATINVGDTTGFPTTGQFQLGSQWVTYTGVTATTFTGCTGGAGYTMHTGDQVSDRTVIEKSIVTNDDNRIIGDIVPDSLYIPQIDGTQIVELETDYPDLSEDERTHDGLWTLAVGGLPGT